MNYDGTSPKKRVHYVNGKIVRQLSEDLGPILNQSEEVEEYEKESVSNTEEDEVEEIISSSEEEESDESDDSYEVEASEESKSDKSESDDDSDYDVDDEVELESVEESEEKDDSTSRSEFDPLPPPIHIPNALKPPHLRTEEDSSHHVYRRNADNYYSDEEDDSSSDDESSFGGKKTTDGEAKSAAKQTFNYDDVDVSYDSDDSDTTASSVEKDAEINKVFTATSVTGEIDKNADDYDEDDTESSKEPEKKVETPPTKSQQLTEDDPALAIRPTSYRGHSFVDNDEDLPEKVRRAGKKPGKWEEQPSSIYEQNGVSSVQKSTFSKPIKTEAKPISEHRPSEVLGQADSGTSALRDVSAVKNESINTPASPVVAEKEKTQTRRFEPIKKKEEKVEEEDWNTEPKDDGNGPYYSYEDLRKKKIEGLDYLNREKYLSPYDFMTVFKVKKSEYETWPKWKKTKAKRSVKLF